MGRFRRDPNTFRLSSRVRGTEFCGLQRQKTGISSRGLGDAVYYVYTRYIIKCKLSKLHHSGKVYVNREMDFSTKR